MTLDIAFEPLALEPKIFNVGDTVRVTVSFKYMVGVNTTIGLCAGPYYTNLFGKHLVESCTGQADIDLVPASTPAEQTATVEFVLIPKDNGGIENGAYGLRVWIEETGALAEQDGIVVVTGNSTGGSSSLTAMMPMIMMLLMLGMVMPMVQQMSGQSEDTSEEGESLA